MKASPKHSLGQYDLKQHKLWFHEEYLQYSYQRKQAKISCLQDPSQSSIKDLHNVKH